MLRQIGGADRPAVAGQVAWAGAYDPAEIDDLARHQRGVAERAHAQRNVHVLAEDIDHAVGDQEIKRDLRVALHEIRQHRHQMMHGDHRKGMHAQVPARRQACGGNIRFRRLDGRENLARMLEIDLALGGQRQASRGPVDEAHPEARFQPADELRHRRWRQADVVGCAGKAAALHHALENGHLARWAGHSRISFLSDRNSLLIIPAL
jgi:hypothetical protein